MKKKLLLTICMVVLLISTFGLAACTGGGGGQQKMEEEIDKVLPKPTEPDKGENDTNSAQFEDFFDGYRVLTNGGSSFTLIDDVDGSTAEFNKLLDRQISTLAEDILYRLFIMYGEGTYSSIDSSTGNILHGNYTDLKLNNDDFTMQNSSAMVVKNQILTHLSDHENVTHDVANGTIYQNIDCIYCYQEIINENSQLLDMNNIDAIKLQGAILGKYTTFEERSNYLEDKINTQKQWKITNFITENKINTNTLNKFKMGIAKLLAGDSDYLAAEYTSENDYNNVLNRINNLGFYANKKDLILEYVNKSIIGETLINENLTIYNSYTDDEKHTITKKLSNEKRLFKGYNVTVPAIVDMALSNTFYNTTDKVFTETTLYPYFLRVNSQLGNFETISKDKQEGDSDLSFGHDLTTTKPIDFNTLILMPKEGVLPSELMLSLNVARDTNPTLAPTSIKEDTNRYKRDIVVELQVNITYVAKGEKIFSSALQAWKEENLTLTIDGAGYVSTAPDPTDPSKPLPPTGEFLPYTFSFDLAGAAKDAGRDKLPSMGKYNGSTAEISSMGAWNNDFVLNDDKNGISLNAGDNYVQVSFNIISIKQKTGGKESELVNYLGTDVVYDLNIMPINF